MNQKLTALLGELKQGLEELYEHFVQIVLLGSQARNEATKHSEDRSQLFRFQRSIFSSAKLLLSAMFAKKALLCDVFGTIDESNEQS